jgi:ABC-type multidrug transport system permease subunit
MNGAMSGFAQIARKEVIHLLRDPTTLVIALLLPIVQLTIFGYAIDFDVRNIKTIVVDLDRSRESRAYLDSLRATQYIDVEKLADTPEQAVESLRRGETKVAVIIPPDFARRSTSRDTPVVRVLIDGSDSVVAVRARAAFSGTGVSAESRRTGVAPESGETPALRPAVEARVNVLFNPDSRSPVFIIPGLIGVILQIVTLSLTSSSLVREREQGTLEQLMVSPVGRLGLMIGKLVPYAALAMTEMAAVLLIGRILFDIRIAGSVLLLLLLSVPFVVAALSMGLLISTIAKNQAQALQITLLITMPSILLSGFVFPRETMPGPLFLLTFAIPVTFFLDILRGIIVRGVGLLDLWQPVTALLILTTILLTLATTRFRKSLT